MQKQIETFKDIQKQIKAYEYALWQLSFNQNTIAPKGSKMLLNKQYAIIFAAFYKLSTNNEYLEAIDFLYSNKEQLLDSDLKKEIVLTYKESILIKKMPEAEYIEYSNLLQSASLSWQDAKEKNDFSIFQPVLEKIVETNIKIMNYLSTEKLNGYDVLLDMYEEGMTVEQYDLFFNELKDRLVPFVLEKTKSTPKQHQLDQLFYDIDKQKKLSDYLLNVIKFNKENGLLAESAHPFCSSVSNFDVRLTTHYHEDNILSNIYSVLHEGGHGLYEQQVNPKYDETYLTGGTSLGIHESQSRFFENMIGRSLIFWETHFPKLQELFPEELGKTTYQEFYAYSISTKRSLIRIEADELTYSLHIILRYEIEKLLMSGNLKVCDLPEKWNELMQTYLGVTPTTDAEGVLQDIHWSGGSFGYFPTYALGSAYAAQFYHAMQKDIDIEQAIADNNISLITNWLKINIHQYGKTKSPHELLQDATGEKFNAKYFIDYLINKYNN